MMTDRLVAFARFLLGVAIALAANFLAESLGPATGSLLRFDLVYRPLLMVFLVFGFSVVILVSRADGQDFLTALGLGVKGSWRRDFGFGVLLGAGMTAVAVGMIAITGHLTMSIRLTRHTSLSADAALIVLLTGALAEELMFRGFPFQRLVDAIGAAGAVSVFSVLFGALHLRNPHASFWGFLNTVLVGVLLSLAYLRTGSLWMPWGIHFAWNATLGLLLGLPVSGLQEFSVVVHSRANGPGWLTGGGYGIEASATGAAVILIGTLALISFSKRRQAPASPPTEV